MNNISSPKSKPKNNRGFSLVEILIVLGVLAIMMVAAFLIYPKISVARDAERQATNLRVIHATISQVFPNHSLFGLTTESLISSGILSEETLTSPWGVIGFHPTKDGHACTSAAGCTGFSLRYDNLEAAQCVALAQAVAPYVNKLRVQGTTNHVLKGTPPNGSEDTSRVIFDPGLLPEACSDGDTVSLYLDMVKM